MNTRQLIALATLTVAGSAFAQEATSDSWTQIAATQTRAAVVADLQQARADGSVKVARVGYLPVIAGQKDRADVRAESAAALRSGEVARIDAEAFAFDRSATPTTVRVAQAAR